MINVDISLRSVELVKNFLSHRPTLTSFVNINMSTADEPTMAEKRHPMAGEDAMAETEVSHHEHQDKGAGMGFETTAADLPPNYYRSIYFCGTMVACGASFAAVSHVHIS